MLILDDPTHTEYDVWDIKLIKAYHFLQDYTAGSFPVWIDDSDRIAFDSKSRISKSKAAIDRAEERNSKKKKTPGQYFYAVPRTIDGGPMPTFEEWAEEQRAKSGVN